MHACVCSSQTWSFAECEAYKATVDSSENTVILDTVAAALNVTADTQFYTSTAPEISCGSITIAVASRGGESGVEGLEATWNANANGSVVLVLNGQSLDFELVPDTTTTTTTTTTSTTTAAVFADECPTTSNGAEDCSASGLVCCTTGNEVCLVVGVYLFVMSCGC